MKLFLLGKMCITFHLYRNSDILLYLFKNKQGALKLKKKKTRTTKYSSQMWYISFVFISWSWHLKWSEWRTCWTHWQPEWWCFCSHPVQTSSAGPKNLWPDFIVISLFFSVFINCTVLFKFFFASTVMIKWWLSSSVTFPCHCYCLSWRYWFQGFEMHRRQSVYRVVDGKITTHDHLSFLISTWDHSGWERGCEGGCGVISY